MKGFPVIVVCLVAVGRWLGDLWHKRAPLHPELLLLQTHLSTKLLLFELLLQPTPFPITLVLVTLYLSHFPQFPYTLVLVTFFSFYPIPYHSGAGHLTL